MAQATLVSDLLAEAAFRLHLPDFDTGEFVTKAEALRILRGSCSRLATLLSSTFGSELFARTDTLTVQAGLDMASLPQDFELLRTVHLGLNGSLLELQPGHPAGDAGLGGFSEQDASSVTWTSCNLPRYWIEDQILRLSSSPSAAAELTVSYVASGLTFVDETSVLMLGAGWDEWLVSDLCIKVRGREQKDASDFRQDRADATQLVMAAAVRRDRFAAQAVRDVRPRQVRNAYWPGRYR